MNKNIDCIDALNSAIASVEIEGYKLDDVETGYYRSSDCKGIYGNTHLC